MNDQERILSILLRLQSGAHLSKNQLSDEFEVSAKTIQRDFSLLGDFFNDSAHDSSRVGIRFKISYKIFKRKITF